MKTRCYCLHCKNHPKHAIRASFDRCVTGFEAGNFIMPEYDEQSAIVNCLEPSCGAIRDEIIDPEDYGFPITAYGDGSSETGFYNRNGLSIHATCANEQDEQ